VVAVVQASFEPAVATRVDPGDRDRAAGADGRADQRRAVVAGDVEAGLAAHLDIQVLGHATGDVGRPAHVATGMRERLAQVQEVDAIRGGQLSQRDHAAAST
jgi:hypothetical protein